MKGFKEYVKAEVYRRGKKMKDLAEACGISEQLLSAYLSEKVKFETYKDRILKGLNQL